MLTQPLLCKLKGAHVVTCRVMFVLNARKFSGHAVAFLVETLCYKTDVRGFDFRDQWIFNQVHPFSCTTALGPT
jgi:hypothetical protein